MPTRGPMGFHGPPTVTSGARFGAARCREGAHQGYCAMPARSARDQRCCDHGMSADFTAACRLLSGTVCVPQGICCALRPPSLPLCSSDAPSAMSRVRVWPGAGGLELFRLQLRGLFSDSAAESVTFHIQAQGQAVPLRLPGLSSYGVASYCAAISAAVSAAPGEPSQPHPPADAGGFSPQLCCDADTAQQAPPAAAAAATPDTAGGDDWIDLLCAVADMIEGGGGGDGCSGTSCGGAQAAQLLQDQEQQQPWSPRGPVRVWASIDVLCAQQLLEVQPLALSAICKDDAAVASKLHHSAAAWIRQNSSGGHAIKAYGGSGGSGGHEALQGGRTAGSHDVVLSGRAAAACEGPRGMAASASTAALRPMLLRGLHTQTASFTAGSYGSGSGGTLSAVGGGGGGGGCFSAYSSAATLDPSYLPGLMSVRNCMTTTSRCNESGGADAVTAAASPRFDGWLTSTRQSISSLQGEFPPTLQQRAP